MGAPDCTDLVEWPGPDLRRVKDRDDGPVAYELLPPRFWPKAEWQLYSCRAAKLSAVQ
jgi:hypothetical protein